MIHRRSLLHLALPAIASATLSCGSQSAARFAGTYQGTLSESYTCPTSSPPTFQLAAQTFVIKQTGSTITLTLSGCPGWSLQGDVAGQTATIVPNGPRSSACQQTDPNGNVMIQIDDFTAGSLTLEGGGDMDVTLEQDATIGGQSCPGLAMGTLARQ